MGTSFVLDGTTTHAQFGDGSAILMDTNNQPQLSKILFDNGFVRVTVDSVEYYDETGALQPLQLGTGSSIQVNYVTDINLNRAFVVTSVGTFILENVEGVGANSANKVLITEISLPTKDASGATLQQQIIND